MESKVTNCEVNLDKYISSLYCSTFLKVKDSHNNVTTQVCQKHRKNCESCPAQVTWKVSLYVSFLEQATVACQQRFKGFAFPVCPGDDHKDHHDLQDHHDHHDHDDHGDDDDHDDNDDHGD